MTPRKDDRAAIVERGELQEVLRMIHLTLLIAISAIAAVAHLQAASTASRDSDLNLADLHLQFPSTNREGAKT